MRRYKEMYPEKIKAKNASQRICRHLDAESHHWSYKEEHWKDIIPLTIKDHAKAHRFIEYDQDTFMYKRKDTQELLDTKEKHLEFINLCITNELD